MERMKEIATRKKKSENSTSVSRPLQNLPPPLSLTWASLLMEKILSLLKGIHMYMCKSLLRWINSVQNHWFMKQENWINMWIINFYHQMPTLTNSTTLVAVAPLTPVRHLAVPWLWGNFLFQKPSFPLSRSLSRHYISGHSFTTTSSQFGLGWHSVTLLQHLSRSC